jgi:hypothetical protein
MHKNVLTKRHAAEGENCTKMVTIFMQFMTYIYINEFQHDFLNWLRVCAAGESRLAA